MNVLEYINLGGVIGRILTILLFFCLIIIIERSIYFLSTTNKIKNNLFNKIKKSSHKQRLLEHSIEIRNESAATRVEKLERFGAQLCHEMEQGLWLLDFISSVAPSLGLLGTVIGLIKSFQGMGSGIGGMDIQNFSNGIWEAMLTTAFGLIVAIPSLFFANYFRRIIEVRTLHMSLAVPVMESSEENNQVIKHA